MTAEWFCAGQVLSGLLLVREPHLRAADAAEDTQLATEVSILSLDSGSGWHRAELCTVGHRRMVLRSFCLRHRSLHLQVY